MMDETQQNLNLKQETNKVADIKVSLVELGIELKEHDYESAQIIADNLWNDVADFAQVSNNLYLTNEVFNKPNTPKDYMADFYDLYNSILNLRRVLMHKNVLAHETMHYTADLRVPYKRFKGTKISPYITYQMSSNGNFNRFLTGVISQVAIRFILCRKIADNLGIEIIHQQDPKSKLKFNSTDVLRHELIQKPKNYDKCYCFLKNVQRQLKTIMRNGGVYYLHRYGDYANRTTYRDCDDLLLSNDVFVDNMNAFAHANIGKWF